MAQRVFVAGATGVIGRRLLPLLVREGHVVVGISRSPPARDALWAHGVHFIAADVFNSSVLTDAVKRSQPQVVIHQLTDLAGLASGGPTDEMVRRNARIRVEGTKNLVAAALAAGARRVIAQSIAWVYAQKQPPYEESDPLDITASEPRATTVNGIRSLEHAVLQSPPIDGVILRYGQLYGPDTGEEQPRGSAPVHVDAAASAAVLAVSKGRSGIYDVSEGVFISSDKARSELDWTDTFRVAPGILGR
jgi:nucleoside-diphosphate-sugar epimerase